jgi:hypothetical protein
MVLDEKYSSKQLGYQQHRLMQIRSLDYYGRPSTEAYQAAQLTY